MCQRFGLEFRTHRRAAAGVMILPALLYAKNEK